MEKPREEPTDDPGRTSVIYDNTIPIAVGIFFAICGAIILTLLIRL